VDCRNTIFLVCLLTLRFAAAVPRAQRAPDDAARRQQSSAPTRFAYGGNAAEIPAEFVGNLIFLPVRINGGKPSLFNLDSRAHATSIDPMRAAALDLNVGSEPGNGPLQPATSIRDCVLNLPGVDFPVSSLAVLSKNDFGSQVGRPNEGTLGSDFLARTVVSIDYARRTVQLYDPGVYQYSGAGSRFHLTFVDGIPVIRAKFSVSRGKALEANFAVNTARDASVVISDRYGEAHHIFSSHLRTIPATAPQSDGEGSAVLGRLKEFELGPFSFLQGVLAVFSRSDIPGEGNPRIAGEIGGGLLRRFTVIFDYPHQQIILEPNAHFSDEDQEDKSGISVIARGPDLKIFEVAQVLPGTPAAAAGIQKGDVIAGVDEEAASDLTLADLRDLFRQVGHQYKLVIARGGQTLPVTVQMRRLL
jgi:hypothetical protein